jgi:hypothetical protein
MRDSNPNAHCSRCCRTPKGLIDLIKSLEPIATRIHKEGRMAIAPLFQDTNHSACQTIQLENAKTLTKWQESCRFNWGEHYNCVIHM